AAARSSGRHGTEIRRDGCSRREKGREAGGVAHAKAGGIEIRARKFAAGEVAEPVDAAAESIFRGRRVSAPRHGEARSARRPRIGASVFAPRKGVAQTVLVDISKHR